MITLIYKDQWMIRAHVNRFYGGQKFDLFLLVYRGTVDQRITERLGLKLTKISAMFHPRMIRSQMCFNIIRRCYHIATLSLEVYHITIVPSVKIIIFSTPTPIRVSEAIDLLKMLFRKHFYSTK